jgi:D-alanyl-D-alanine carboxypeptidase
LDIEIRHRAGNSGPDLDELLARIGPRGTALVTCGDLVWQSGDVDASFVIYSVTKSAIAAAFLLFEQEGVLDLDSSIASALGDGRLDASLRQLLTHTSGIPDYGRVPDYQSAVYATPSQPWSDDRFFEHVAAAGQDFAPGEGWAYSNTGYLLLRRVLDLHGGLASQLPAVGFRAASVAENLADFDRAVSATSRKLGDGIHQVAGRYHPGWVGHRTIVTTARDLHRFWSTPPAKFLDPATLVPVGFDAPGFARPCYGLGVMADPDSPLGLVIGHGGGGPGYSAAVFAAPQQDALAIVLEPTEDFPAQELAHDLLNAAHPVLP